jgi:hypothetical protein
VNRPPSWLALAVLLCAGCATTPPPAPTPTDTVFYGQTFDCTSLDTRAAQGDALKCADTADVQACMIETAHADGAPDIVCGARDAQVAIFIQAARGAASDATKAQSAKLRAWLLAEKIQLRN